jgi:hypothetical protein
MHIMTSPNNTAATTPPTPGSTYPTAAAVAPAGYTSAGHISAGSIRVYGRISVYGRQLEHLESRYQEMVTNVYRCTLRCFYEELSKTLGLVSLTAIDVGYMTQEELFAVFRDHHYLVRQIIETRANYHDFQRALVR